MKTLKFRELVALDTALHRVFEGLVELDRLGWRKPLGAAGDTARDIARSVGSERQQVLDRIRACFRRTN